ncbi:MAG: pectate lyase, partial [candidate division NC10 bacterium]
GRPVAENVLSHQSSQGSWPKNTDTAARRYEGDPAKLQGTFDNGATVGEMQFLARAYNATKDDRDKAAFLKGLDHILQAQYATGGWPQFYPPGKGYHRHITFNDGTMVNLVLLLREVSHLKTYEFVDPPRREKARRAFERGIECVLKCQIVVNGQQTAWCAQHDEVTLEPRKGRSYEHASISGGESVGIVRLLMSVEKPSPEVVRAVNAACRWFEQVKLTGIRVELRDGDKVVVKDPGAPPLWARFYEIGTNRPIFSGRDGVIKYSMAEIEPERRNGYAWYGTWPAPVLAQWPKWKAEHGQ